MNGDLIYLDHSTTTPLDDRVAAAMQSCAQQYSANPSSQHEPGRQARRALETARDRIARLLGAQVDSPNPDQLVLTSGATEANNLAILGLAGPRPGRIIVSAIEHPSVTAPAEHLASQGFEICRLPVAASGAVKADALTELLSPDTRLVSVMWGNHETGVLQPIHRLATICRQAGVPLHTDAVQAAGRIPIDFSALGLSAMAISAHKLNGPSGVGALLIRHDTSISPLLFGGLQQRGIRPGTEPIHLAVGLQTALEIWTDERSTRTPRIVRFRERFETQLRTAWPNMVVHGLAVPRLPHICCVSFPGFDRQALVIALDMAGVACSTGTACASGSTEPSPVLEAMGCHADLLGSALRFSFGADTTSEQVDEAIRRILGVLKRLQSGKHRQNSLDSAPLPASESL